jgi:HD superfamily phosphohydrolase YqeK
MSEWAGAMGISSLESARWLRAAWLHDALRDADEAQLRRWSGDETSGLYFLHGPAAAVRAREEGEVDNGVLAAIRWHTVGFAEWDEVGRTLYCADFLEPGRTFECEIRAALARRFPDNPPQVLSEIAQLRMTYAIRQGWELPPETVAFVRALAG